MAGTRFRPEPVLEGVLDEGLEDQGGHILVRNVGRYFEVYLEAVAEAGLLDVEVGAEEFDLVADVVRGRAECARTWRKTLARRRVMASARGGSRTIRSATVLRELKRKWGLTWARRARSSASVTCCWRRASRLSRSMASCSRRSGVEAIAGLGGDGAKVVEVMAHEARARGAGGDEEHVADAAGGGDRDEDFDVGNGKEALQGVGGLQFDGFAFEEGLRPVRGRKAVDGDRRGRRSVRAGRGRRFRAAAAISGSSERSARRAAKRRRSAR